MGTHLGVLNGRNQLKMLWPTINTLILQNHYHCSNYPGPLLSVTKFRVRECSFMGRGAKWE